MYNKNRNKNLKTVSVHFRSSVDSFDIHGSDGYR